MLIQNRRWILNVTRTTHYSSLQVVSRKKLVNSLHRSYSVVALRHVGPGNRRRFSCIDDDDDPSAQVAGPNLENPAIWQTTFSEEVN